MAAGCETNAAMVSLKKSNEAKYKAVCQGLREDGAFVEAGENDNLIVQKLAANPNAIGVFGYSYLEQNLGTVDGVAIDGVKPTYATIAAGAYPGSRPLYVYVKKAHLRAIPGLTTFLKLYAAAWGPDGPLVRRGLIAAPEAVRAKAAAVVANETPLNPAELGS